MEKSVKTGMNGVETGSWVKYLWEYDRAQHLSTESTAIMSP